MLWAGCGLLRGLTLRGETAPLPTRGGRGHRLVASSVLGSGLVRKVRGTQLVWGRHVPRTDLPAELGGQPQCTAQRGHPVEAFHLVGHELGLQMWGSCGLRGRGVTGWSTPGLGLRPKLIFQPCH